MVRFDNPLLLALLVLSPMAFAEGRYSETSRAAKQFEVGLDILGFTPSPTAGLYANLFLTPTHALSLRASNSSAFFSDQTYKQLSVDIRSFWGNTLYTNFGLGFRRHDLKWDTYTEDEEGFDTGKITIRQKPETIGLEFALGNQWYFASGFTLGTDWVGFMIPISHKDTEMDAKYSDTEEERYSLSDMRKDLDEVKQNQFYFLRFYLGWAF